RRSGERKKPVRALKRPGSTSKSSGAIRMRRRSRFPTWRDMRRKIWLPTYLIFCCLILPLQSWLDTRVFSRRPLPHRLVIVLDGVPFQTIADLRAEGRFSRFKQPARMISTFPSLTNPAMIEILRAEDSPGYEDHFYDRGR